MRSLRSVQRSWLISILGGASLALLGIPGLLPPRPAAAQAAKDPRTDRLWRAKCAACHGDDGKAQSEQGKKMGIADMTTAAWQKSLSDDQIKKAIGDGLKREKGGKQQEMEPFKDKLRPEQLDSLLPYLRGLAK